MIVIDLNVEDKIYLRMPYDLSNTNQRKKTFLIFPKNMICSNYTTNWARSLTGESLGIAMTDGE